VSLHSHTCYSHEGFGILEKILKRYLSKQQSCGAGSQLDRTRIWWTPPCPPYHAWSLEKNQIERLQLHPLVSLTDHDQIEAPLKLRILQTCRRVPVSLEWTVPYGPALFHLGIHNLAAERAPAVFATLAHYTSMPRPRDLRSILETLAADRQVLIVFNHPLWDETGLGAERHAVCAARFLHMHHRWIHALELNGFRPWKENRKTIQLAHTFQRPVISGGDRHGFEPSALLDLTNAETFTEYAEQVRSGHTNILVMRQYREPRRLRTLQCVREMLQDYPSHGGNASRWTDRVFYQGEDGEVRSLARMSGLSSPTCFELAVKIAGLLSHPNLQRTFRLLSGQPRRFAL